MKAVRIIVAAANCLALLVCGAYGQGSLTPSGTPAATMKTLQQVEPRTPISSAGYVISQSGSYYLTTNLTAVSRQDGITVNADDVTIDLNGFTLAGDGGSSGHGIYQVSTLRNLTVFNGKIVNWRSFEKYGIDALGSSSIFRDLQVSTNYYGIRTGVGSVLSGCTAMGNIDRGIHIGSISTLNGCTARGNGAEGIYAANGCTLNGCVASSNGDRGIHAGNGCTLSGCVAYSSVAIGIYADQGSTLIGCAAQYGESHGIYAGNGCTLSGCSALWNDFDGIQVSPGCTVSRCTAKNNTGDGIESAGDGHIRDCTCHHNGYSTGDGAGIHASSYDTRIDGNTVTDNDRGIDVDFAGNLIVRNSASGNGTNYVIVSGNDVGTIQTTPVGAGAWDNFSY